MKVLVVPPAAVRDEQSVEMLRVWIAEFRLRSAAAVEALHAALVTRGDARIVRAPEPGEWAPGDYSILFEDPDGIRLEANFVPGRGNLDVIGDGPPLDAADFGRHGRTPTL